MPSGSQSARVLTACSTLMPLRSATGPNRLRRSAISPIPGTAVSIIHNRAERTAGASAAAQPVTQHAATSGSARPVVESIICSADHGLDAVLGVVDGPEAAAGR